ncbi:hypothetical protein VPH35_133554 [Triticum aestivum]
MELPDEVLADVLRRVLQPQHLAACRRVCTNWCRVIDDHKLLLPHLLPAAPRGLFINYTARDGWSDARYFSRGILDGTIDTGLGFAPPWNAVIDHCNGLLLCASQETCFVYNPVTWRSAQLPAPPGAQEANWGIGSAVYLVPRRRYTVYWRQFLYIQCRAGFVIRFSVITEEYQVIQSPRIVSPHKWWEKPITYLGKSMKGVYYTTTDYLKLRVWVLREETEASYGALPVWEMIHNADLEPPLSQLSHENCEENDKSWILDHEKAVQTEHGYQEWDSDNDDIFVSNDEQHDDDDENDGYADDHYI